MHRLMYSFTFFDKTMSSSFFKLGKQYTDLYYCRKCFLDENSYSKANNSEIYKFILRIDLEILQKVL